MRLLTALVLATVVAAPAHAADSACTRKGPALLRTSTVLVYESGPSSEEATVCARLRRSRVPARYLGEKYGLNGLGERWGAKLFDAAGEHVAWASFAEDSRDGTLGSVVESVELRSRRYRQYAPDAWESNRRRVTDVEIDARGRVAWIETTVGPTWWDVRTRRAFVNRVVRDEGPGIAPTSLTRRRATVSWRHDGRRRSASLSGV